VVGWLIPGGGYWLIGQRTRATVIGATIVTLFLAGVLIGGVRVIESPDLTGPGSIVAKILKKPWFLGQALVGPLGLAGAWLSRLAAASAQYHTVISHARLSEIGTLYTAVAGMLNLLAIIDASHRSGRHA
jgi:hypothetical protein